MPYVVNPDDSNKNPPNPVQSTTYSLPNFDCVPNGGQCIHSGEGEQCTNGMLTFHNCRTSGGGQCCKFGFGLNLD